MRKYRPAAYRPEQGYMYQLFVRLRGTSEWEHCDYGRDRHDTIRLVAEYKLAYGPTFEFHSEKFPRQWWKQPEKEKQDAGSGSNTRAKPRQYPSGDDWLPLPPHG